MSLAGSMADPSYWKQLIWLDFRKSILSNTWRVFGWSSLKQPKVIWRFSEALCGPCATFLLYVFPSRSFRRFSIHQPELESCQSLVDPSRLSTAAFFSWREPDAQISAKLWIMSTNTGQACMNSHSWFCEESWGVEDDSALEFPGIFVKTPYFWWTKIQRFIELFQEVRLATPQTALHLGSPGPHLSDRFFDQEFIPTSQDLSKLSLLLGAARIVKASERSVCWLVNSVELVPSSLVFQRKEEPINEDIGYDPLVLGALPR